MQDLVIKSYGDLVFHKTIGELIKEHSENKEDIREIAKGLINFDEIHDILDIGCGFGWFEESLANGFHSILGIDCLEANEQGFLSVAKRVASKSLFKQMLLPAPIDVEADSFDLVVSAYSLYFFPGVLPEVRRVLRPGGIFLIITHSASMLEEGEEAVAYIEKKSKDEGVSFEKAILKGNPSDELLRYSKELGTDILVIGSIGRTGLSKFLLGSVAEKVVRHSDVPVMVVPFSTQ